MSEVLQVGADPVLIARAFVEARRSDQLVLRYPGPIPSSAEEAYAIQDQAIRLRGQPVSGWKVGRVADDLAEHWGSDRLAGPIFSDSIVYAGGSDDPDMPLLRGFAAVEAEIVMRTGAPIPHGCDLRSLPDYIDDVHLGLEIASSPFPGINANGPGVTASDFGNNFGLLVGPRIGDWKTRNLLDAIVALSIDGKTVGQGCAATMLDGPFGAVAFLAQLLDRRGIPMPAGTLISTGAITGVHLVSAGQSVSATLDGQIEVACRTRSFTPSMPVRTEA